MKSKNTDMTQGNILSVLLRFTIPVLIGDLFQQLYNIVDTIIVGRTLGADALAAVGATGSVMFLIIGFSCGLAGGFAVVTSHHFGARDAAGIRQSFSNGFYLVLAVSAILIFFCLTFLNPLLTLMNTPDNIFAQSYAYISIIIAGLPFTILYNYLASNLRSIGNSKVPLYFLVLSSGTNIVLDLVFIVTFHMGVSGAALATILSQGVSVVGCFIYIFAREASLVPEKKDWRINRALILRQLQIGLPMGLQTAITASGTVIMQSATNSFGSVIVAANTTAMKARSIFTQPFMSLGFSMATYCGQNYGSKNMDRVHDGVITAIKLLTVCAILSAIVSNVFLPWELKLFISDPAEFTELLPWAKLYIRYNSFFYIPLAYIFVFRSSLQGCGRSVFAMGGGIMELIIRLILATAALKTHYYMLAVLGDPLAWLGAGVFFTISWFIIEKQLRAELEAEAA